MDAAKWSQGNHQEIGLMKPMEEIVSSNTCTSRPVLERKARPPEQLNCPRCNSTNTKFCYYNNYSLTQPRYFCKTCRRYWTEGGSLRNVPVGGGSRKNKRSSSLSSTSTTSSSSLGSPKVIPDLNPPNLSHFSQIPHDHKMHKGGQDLNLAFPAMQESQQAMPQFLQAPKIESNGSHQENPSSSSASVPYNSSLSALGLLRTGIASTGLSSFVPAGGPVMDSSCTTLYSSGFSLQDYKPALGFTIDHGLGNRAAGAMNGVHQENGGRINFFPFGEIKQVSGTSNEVDQSKGQGNSSGYWNNNGVLGGPW